MAKKIERAERFLTRSVGGCMCVHVCRCVCVRVRVGLCKREVAAPHRGAFEQLNLNVLGSNLVESKWHFGVGGDCPT